MHKTLRHLPSLDFLRGFEAAGRRLSFTLAAEELFLTQSALSRQVKALEDALGVALFERRHRALALTQAGEAFHRNVTAQLREIALAAESVRGQKRDPGLTVSTTVSFAALWLIPRLASFRAAQPAVEVYVSANDRMVDLGRGDVDVAVRYLADAGAPPGSARLFGERLLPVASPALQKRGGAPLKQPSDLAGHVLIHLDDPSAAPSACPVHPLVELAGVVDVERPTESEARRIGTLLPVRPGDPGSAWRARCRAWTHTAYLRTVARRKTDRAVSEAI